MLEILRIEMKLAKDRFVVVDGRDPSRANTETRIRPVSHQGIVVRKDNAIARRDDRRVAEVLEATDWPSLPVPDRAGKACGEYRIREEAAGLCVLRHVGRRLTCQR